MNYMNDKSEINIFGLISLGRKTNTVLHLFIIFKAWHYTNYIYGYTNYKLAGIMNKVHAIPSLNPTL